MTDVLFRRRTFVIRTALFPYSKYAPLHDVHIPMFCATEAVFAGRLSHVASGRIYVRHSGDNVDGHSAMYTPSWQRYIARRWVVSHRLSVIASNKTNLCNNCYFFQYIKTCTRKVRLQLLRGLSSVRSRHGIKICPVHRKLFSLCSLCVRHFTSMQIIVIKEYYLLVISVKTKTCLYFQICPLNMDCVMHSKCKIK